MIRMSQKMATFQPRLADPLTDAGVQSTTAELLFDEVVQLRVLLSSSQLLLDMSRPLDGCVLVDGTGSRSSSLGSDGLAVVLLVCNSERGSIDLDDGTLDQGICSDQLVVRGVKDDSQYTGLGGDVFRAPSEVATVKEAPEGGMSAIGSLPEND